MSDELKQQIDQLKLENMIHKMVLSSILQLLDRKHPEWSIGQSYQAFYAENLMHYSAELSPDLAEYLERYMLSLVNPQ